MKPKNSLAASLYIQLFGERLSDKTVRDNTERHYGYWRFMVLGWGFRCFSEIEGNKTNKCIDSFSFRVGLYPVPQSINAKHFLPIIPIGIVAHAFTLLLDNLCRNSYIYITHSSQFVDSLQRRANAQNVSFRISLRWPIHIINLVKKNKLLCINKPTLSYFTDPVDLPVSQCGSVINNALKSPGYPKNYPSDMDCNYTVPVPHNMTMNITFISFKLEDIENNPLCL